MSTKEVYIRFYATLVEALQLHDKLFLAKLYSHGLLTDNLMEEVNVKGTRFEKAAHFLDEKIRRDINIGDSKSFVELLDIMEGSDDSAIKHLARKIKNCLPINSAG